MQQESSIDIEIKEFLENKRRDLEFLSNSIEEKIASLKGNNEAIDSELLSIIYDRSLF